MAEPTGGGNPNVFTTFKGRGILAPLAPATVDNPIVMLSCVNDVQFCGNFTLAGYKAGDVIATLPEGFRPTKTIAIPVVANYNVDVLYIDEAGTLKLATGFTETAPVYTAGLSFNISANFYKEG